MIETEGLQGPEKKVIEKPTNHIDDGIGLGDLGKAQRYNRQNPKDVCGKRNNTTNVSFEPTSKEA